MVTFFDTRYHEAYKQLINELSEFLVVDDVDGMHIERLEFRSDLKRGDRKLIWQAFARMLRAGGKGRTVMAKNYCQEDLFWWLADERHCNLGEKFRTIKWAVYQSVTNLT